MTIIREEKTLVVDVGSKCDRCGAETDYIANHLQVDTRLGYESDCDGLDISFSLCDHCLLEIVLETIPNAKFSEGSLRMVPTLDELTEIVRNRVAKI